MKDDLIGMKIKGIEEQLRVLRRQLEKQRSDQKTPEQKKGLAGLEGIWRGELDITDEDIEAAKIKVKDFTD